MALLKTVFQNGWEILKELKIYQNGPETTLLVYTHYFDHHPEGMKINRKIKRIISESNLFLLDNMKELSDIFESDQFKNNNDLLETYRKSIELKHDYFKKKIINTMARLLSFIEDNNIKPGLIVSEFQVGSGFRVAGLKSCL